MGAACSWIKRAVSVTRRKRYSFAPYNKPLLTGYNTLLYIWAMSDVHPFRRWREEHGYSANVAAAMLRAKGRRVSKRYLDAIEVGARRPSYETCEAMQVITDGAVTVAALRHWPPLAARRRASAA